MHITRTLATKKLEESRATRLSSLYIAASRVELCFVESGLLHFTRWRELCLLALAIASGNLRAHNRSDPRLSTTVVLTTRFDDATKVENEVTY